MCHFLVYQKLLDDSNGNFCFSSQVKISILTRDEKHHQPLTETKMKFLRFVLEFRFEIRVHKKVEKVMQFKFLPMIKSQNARLWWSFLWKKLVSSIVWQAHFMFPLVCKGIHKILNFLNQLREIICFTLSAVWFFYFLFLGGGGGKFHGLRERWGTVSILGLK